MNFKSNNLSAAPFEPTFTLDRQLCAWRRQTVHVFFTRTSPQERFPQEQVERKGLKSVEVSKDCISSLSLVAA